MTDAANEIKTVMLSMLESHLAGDMPYRDFDRAFSQLWARHIDAFEVDDPDWTLIGEVADQLSYSTEKPIALERRDGIRDAAQFAEIALRLYGDRFGEEAAQSLKARRPPVPKRGFFR